MLDRGGEWHEYARILVKNDHEGEEQALFPDLYKQRGGNKGSGVKAE